MNDRMKETAPLSFDGLADVFDAQRGLPSDALSALYHVFLDATSDGPLRIVEPGAGTGRIVIPALAAGHHVTGIDVSQAMLDVFAARISDVPDLASRSCMIVADAAALPFDDGTFDLGMLAQVLYLIPDWQRALDELVRVVRPGGEVMLVQERSTMSPALRDRDAAWRVAVESVGYRHMPQRPDDTEATAALVQRAGQVTEDVVASWPFGQTVSDADAGLQRLRSLYATLGDNAWKIAVERFGEWQRSHHTPSETWLGGTVDLVLVHGVVPDAQR